MFPPKPGRGRPKKFGRPARSITLTLPDDVVERLAAMNGDLARAVVGLVEKTPGRAHRRQATEVATHGNRSVILVTPVPALSRLRGVQLVPVADGRALIALDHPNGIPQLELDLRDALENARVKGRERAVLQAVAETLRSARQSHRLTVFERSIIVFEGRRRRTASSSPD